MPVLPLSADEGPGLPVAERVPDQLCPVGLGVLTGEISPGVVDEVIGLAGCREKRRRLLPARTVVYFVLGLCLFSGADSTGAAGVPVGDALADERAAAPGRRGAADQLGADQSQAAAGSQAA